MSVKSTIEPTNGMQVEQGKIYQHASGEYYTPAMDSGTCFMVDMFLVDQYGNLKDPADIWPVPVYCSGIVKCLGECTPRTWPASRVGWGNSW